MQNMEDPFVNINNVSKLLCISFKLMGVKKLWVSKTKVRLKQENDEDAANIVAVNRSIH